MSKQSYVYLLSNNKNTVIYCGVTSNLVKRAWEHKSKAVPGFTSKYNLQKLVYYEVCEEIEQAILREKQIKAGSRAKKEQLIVGQNPNWEDLYERITASV